MQELFRDPRWIAINAEINREIGHAYQPFCIKHQCGYSSYPEDWTDENEAAWTAEMNRITATFAPKFEALRQERESENRPQYYGKFDGPTLQSVARLSAEDATMESWNYRTKSWQPASDDFKMRVRFLGEWDQITAEEARAVTNEQEGE